MAQTSQLCSIPREVLENVALQLVLTEPLGPPSVLIPLLQTCKTIYQRLEGCTCPDLYAEIFRAKFDVSAAVRRFDNGDIANKPTRSSNLGRQLKVNCITLKAIRDGDMYNHYLEETLWDAFYMMLENDGKNKCQLEHAGLDQFIDRLVRTRLMEDNENGWPADNVINSLCLWLMWMTTTEDKLRAESEQKRHEIIRLVLPYVVLSFRYPTAHAPPNHFIFPLAEAFHEHFPVSFNTVHGRYPLYRYPGEVTQRCILYNRDLRIAQPLISTAAKLIYFSRREIIPFATPVHLPLTRAHAIQLGRTDVGPTQADIAEFNAHTDTKMVPRTQWDSWGGRAEHELEDDFTEASEMWDKDWKRLAYCVDPRIQRPLSAGMMYTPGVLNGLWQGRMLVPNEPEFNHLIGAVERPPTFSEASPQVTTVPIYMRLREHHCITPQQPIGPGGVNDGFDDGLRKAYFPTMQIQKNSDDIAIAAEDRVVRYETFVKGKKNSHNEDTCQTCIQRNVDQERQTRMPSSRDYEADFAALGLGMDTEDDDAPYVDLSEDDYEVDVHGNSPRDIMCTGIQDIAFTGETDLRHGQAWNHFSFFGRVRSWDGLIAILRAPVDRRLGGIIFYGYIVGGQNFVGTWRVAGEHVGLPAWESAFSMSRRED